MLLYVITVRQHSSIAILLMDPRGIWLMKPNVFCKVFSTFPKNSKVSPVRVHQQNSNVAVCDHCRAKRQHCYFADGPSRDMSHETKCVPQSLFNFRKNKNVSPARVHQQYSNAAVCDHCRATRQHCYFADGLSRDMAYEKRGPGQGPQGEIGWG